MCPYFEGPVESYEIPRLSNQQRCIFDLMIDSQWRTLGEIASITGYPEASISAQLRHLRKPRFGAHEVNKRRRTDNGLWEYQLIPRIIEPRQEKML